MKRILTVSTLFALVVWIQAGHSLTKEIELEDLTPTLAHKRATDLITSFISNYHYKKTPLDDQLSEQILDKYLESLDPNRSYFLLEDISKFEKYRTQLDDSLRNADLHPAYEIFKVFRKRVDQRVNFALQQLDKKQDFTVEEDYIFDRKDAPWASDIAMLDEMWRKRLKNDVLSLKLSDKKPDELHDLLKKRYESLARRTHQINSEDVFQYFMNSYTTSIEPHTSYFSPRTSENFDIQMRLSLEGIGAVLQSEDEHTMIKEIIIGGPADLDKKLKAKDKIVGVGQGKEGPIVDVVGWRLDDVVDLIRGPKGSHLRLEIIPKTAGASGARTVITLKRNKINLEEQAAKSYLLELPVANSNAVKKIGIIALPTFYLDFAALSRGEKDYRSSTRDVKFLIDQLREENIEGLIIDLRSNGGGSLLEATSLTGLFIETGPVVQVKDAIGRIEINDDSDPTIAYQGPLAVLVDRYSASASEIFAGAIQDYRRGVIIGEPTFGKGTVQNLIDLNKYDDRSENTLGHLKTTIAQFFRVSGNSTQHRGVVPDFIYPTGRENADYGESAYENALPWASVSPATFRAAMAPVEAFATIRGQHEQRIAEDPAFKLLIEEIETVKVLQERNTVSLSEKIRRSELDDNEQKSKELEARHKVVAKSLPTLIKHENHSEKVETKTDDDSETPEKEDILLIEAARILQDLINERTQPSTKPQLVNKN
ncbi:MAG: carboxy terminal-processing peptidase [Gammaproteobacteria bacterium]